MFLCAGHLIEGRKGAALGLSGLVTSCFNTVNCQFLWSHFSLCCTEAILHSGKVTFVNLIACIFVLFLHKDAALLSYLQCVLCTAQSILVALKAVDIAYFLLCYKMPFKENIFLFFSSTKYKVKAMEITSCFKSYI